MGQGNTVLDREVNQPWHGNSVLGVLSFSTHYDLLRFFAAFYTH